MVLTTVNSPVGKKNTKLQEMHNVVGLDTFSTVQIKSHPLPTLTPAGYHNYDGPFKPQ